MSMYDENADNFDDGEGDQPEESNNRTFLFIAGGLGILVLIGLCALAGYFLLGNTTSQQTLAETSIAVQTEQQATLNAGSTQFAQSQAETQTAAVTLTLPATNTPVIAVATETPSPTQNPATATVGAAFTQIAVSTQTIIPISTALPNTGFADDVGIPGMFAMTLALVVVIFLVRRLRAAPIR
jgi:type II secretory pathway pseudopilin PulG